jgi:methylmalonyl-CoA mutase N-terminal domain/subunit
VEHGLDLRLPHPRGRLDRAAGAGLHAARRHRVRAVRRRRGIDVDAFAPRLSFFFNSHNDFFEEIAKFRAARRIWATVMRERFGAKNPRSLDAPLPHPDRRRLAHRAAAGTTTSCARRLQALAAVLGGTQSLHTNSLDETLALPTEEAVTIALRTQQIIAEETGVAHTVDPLGGSYFVEKLTNDIEADAMEYIRKIDAMGGMVAAVEKGFPSARSARRRIASSSRWSAARRSWSA